MIKPVYDEAQIITALTTQDGGQPSLAWSTDIITFSIDTGPIDPTNPEYTDEISGYVAMTDGKVAAAREAFALYDDLIAVDLLEMSDWPSAHITINESSNTGGDTYAAFSYWEVDNDPRSQYKLADADVWLADDWTTQDEDSDFFQGSFGIETYLHEIGHALGLTHPGNYNGTANYALDATHRQDTQQYSVMSYFQAGADGSGTDHIGTVGRSYGATPLLHDILALQAIYGADMTTRTGGTTYGFNSTAGRDAFDFTININPVVAIWDAGGIDRIDASGFDTNQIIDLNAGAFSSVGALTGNVAIAYGATIEQAVGGGGNDRLVGNAVDNLLIGNGGVDRLEGHDGNDTIQGGTGADLLYGGAGNDTLEGGSDDGTGSALQAPPTVPGSSPGGNRRTGDAAGDVNRGTETGSGSEPAGGRAGSNSNDRIFGEDGNDIISGQSGNDFLLGGAGDDIIDGGSGNDMLRGGLDADHLIGGTGEDWAQYDTAAAGVTLSLITGGTGGEAAGDTFDGIENVSGSRFADDLTGDAAGNRIMAGAGNDIIDGGAGSDMLFGEAGNDTLTGGADDDELVGGAGADVLIGGGGNDWARYDTSRAGVTVNLATGTGLGGDAAGDTLGEIEFLRGSAFADTLTGDNGVNMIHGGGGNDVIRGGDGDDILDGHSGADIFVFGIGDDMDRIDHFNLLDDLIRFDSVASGFGDLIIANLNGDAAITYGVGDVILLTGIDLGAVTAGLFDFV